MKLRANTGFYPGGEAGSSKRKKIAQSSDFIRGGGIFTKKKFRTEFSVARKNVFSPLHLKAKRWGKNREKKRNSVKICKRGKEKCLTFLIMMDCLIPLLIGRFEYNFSYPPFVYVKLYYANNNSSIFPMCSLEGSDKCGVTPAPLG